MIYDSRLTILISKFVALERLSIDSPTSLPVENHIRLYGVHGDSESKLKYLSISKFANISSIRVSDMKNLVSLRCHGLESYELYLHNLEKIADVSIIL